MRGQALYRVMALLVAAAVTAALTVSINRAEAVITTPFDVTFSADANGDIILRGNTSLTCPAAATGCPDALNGVGSGTGESLNNNGYVMQNLDTDADPATFNSSSTNLSLLTGSTVLFAALYWSANVTAGAGTGATAPSATDKNKVKFAGPGQAYATVTAAETDVSGSAYQGYADVTALVAGAGSGSYTVADIQAGTGLDRYAGWALVVAYQNPAAKVRNLRIYDGFGVVSSGSTSVNIPVTGFQTPQSGTVNTKIGAVVYEGDLGKTGDTLQLNGTSMADAVNPVNNFFNSTVSDNGALVTDRTPGNTNLLGVDIDRFDASGLLANNATGATLTLTTTSETFYPGVVTFATDLYAPNLTATMTSQDVNGGNLLPGDTLRYTVDVVNDGTDTAIDSLLTDAVPAGTGYVPGSLTIGGSPVTDPAGDDAGSFATDSAQGSTSFALGELAPNATARVTFTVKINLSTPGGTTITDVANVAYTGKNTGRHIAGTSSENDVVVIRPAADLAAGLTVAPPVVQRDGTADPVSYRLSVIDNGPDLEPAVRARLTLPAGVTASSTLPAGCTATGRLVTCDLGPLAAGTTATRRIDAVADNSALGAADATAVATGTGSDSVPGNDSQGATLAVNAAPVTGNDSAATTNGTAKTVTVLGNDSDADGDPLTVSVASQPSHGGATANAGGTITYTPALGYAGADSFTYTAADGRAGTSTAIVTMTVANAAPAAVDDLIAAAAGQAVTVTVLDNDSDPNSDAIAVTGVTQPAGGGTAGFTSGLVTFTPTASFAGAATFSYTITDARGGTATAQVTVTVANAAPVATNHVAGTPYRTDLVVDALDGATDANGDTLTVASVTPPAHGSVTLTAGVVTYRAPAGFSGPASFTYTISDGHSGTATATMTVTVGNAAPTAADETVTTAYATPARLDVLADAADPNGDTLQVTGVGAAPHGTVVRNPDGTLTYTPAAAYSGPDSFSYVISDSNGGTDTGTVSVTVANAPPFVRADAVTAETNLALTVDALGNDSDPNGDPLAVTVDGAPAHGTAVVNPDGTVTYTPAGGYHGPDSFDYSVSDGHGGTAGATVSITVVGSPPIATDDSAVTPTSTAITLDVLSNDSDPSGDPISVTGFINGGHGTVVRTVNGTLGYTPATGFAGIDTFSYTIEDPAHGSATALVTLTVLNANPIAVADPFTVRPGIMNSLRPLVNDTDPNTGQTLRVVSTGPAAHGTAAVGLHGTVTYIPAVGATGTDAFDYVITDDAGGTAHATITVTIDTAPVAAEDSVSTGSGLPVTIWVLGNDTDAENDTLSVTSLGAAHHGTVTLGSDGAVHYTPAAGFFGTDSFPYSIQDSAGAPAGATVAVRVSDAAPVAGADRGALVRNGHVEVDVLANDTDANPRQTLTVGTVGAPAHGTAVRTGGGKIRYTPATGFTGPDSFSYVVGDGFGGTATQTVDIIVSAGAPVALPEQKVTPYRHAVSLRVLTNDLDPTGGLRITGVTTPAGGTVTSTADTVTFTPGDGFTGATTFTYTATDSAGIATSALVTVTVGAPPAVPDQTAAAKPGAPVTIALPTVDQNHHGVRVIAVTQPAHGTAKLLANGKVTYTPAAGFAGTDTFTYSALDANGNRATASVTVTVAGPNQSPAPTPDTAAVTVGRSIVINVLTGDKDPDGDRLTVTEVGTPKHGTALLNKNGTVTYAPLDGWNGGVDSFTYTVSDGHGHTAAATVTVTVDPAAAIGVKLPKTGADVMTVAGGGMLVVLVGGVLLFLGNRGGHPMIAGGGLVHRGPGRHRPGRHSVGYHARWA